MSNHRQYITNADEAKAYCQRMIENARKNGLIIEYVVGHHIEGGFTCTTTNFTDKTIKVIAKDMIGYLEDMDE